MKINDILLEQTLDEGLTEQIAKAKQQVVSIAKKFPQVTKILPQVKPYKNNIKAIINELVEMKKQGVSQQEVQKYATAQLQKIAQSVAKTIPAQQATQLTESDKPTKGDFWIGPEQGYDEIGYKRAVSNWKMLNPDKVQQETNELFKGWTVLITLGIGYLFRHEILEFIIMVLTFTFYVAVAVGAVALLFLGVKKWYQHSKENNISDTDDTDDEISHASVGLNDSDIELMIQAFILALIKNKNGETDTPSLVGNILKYANNRGMPVDQAKEFLNSTIRQRAISGLTQQPDLYEKFKDPSVIAQIINALNK